MSSDVVQAGRSQFSLRSLFAVTALVAVVVICVAGVYRSTFFFPVRDLQVEADKLAPTLDAVYRYRYAHGSWPDRLQSATPEHHDRHKAANVRYGVAVLDDVAQLSIRGSMHTEALYVFALSQSTTTLGWSCSLEGTSVAFDVDYEPPDRTP